MQECFGPVARRGSAVAIAGAFLLSAVAAAPPRLPAGPPSRAPASSRPAAPPKPTPAHTGPTAGPPAAGTDAATAVEERALGRTELAGAGGTRPASGPASPASAPAASSPAAAALGGPESVYPDVSFARRSSTRPAPTPRPLPVNVVADAEIERAIRSGTKVLIDQIDPNTGRLRDRRYAETYEALECGLNALCVYALLQAGQAIDEPALRPTAPLVRAMLDGCKRIRADRGVHQTYARALRATAMAVYNRPDDRRQLTEDVGCLVAGHFGGGYGYLSAVPTGMAYRFSSAAPDGMPTEWLDHSNSQYGLLGVWSGAEAGVEVPGDYWRQVTDHWTDRQSAGGKWAYLTTGLNPRPGQSHRPPDDVTTLSMTAAGTASLFVANEYATLAAGAFKVGRDPFPDALRRALAWWDQGDHAVDLGRGGPGGAQFGRAAKHWGYTLYGVERVGLASGFKFFGDNDWYRSLARQAVDRQRPDGSWGDLVDTAYAVAFLARGRPPVLVNKLRFDGRDEVQPDYWANRPNDAAFLTRFAARALERPLNWQVVPLKKDWTDWLEAPVLYLASHQRPRFAPADVDKLRRYAEAGGLIFVNTDRDPPGAGGSLEAMASGGASGKASDDFDRFVTDLAAKLFPDHKLADLPNDHPLYGSVYKLADKPRLRAVTNGSRLLLVHSPTDLALRWQRRDDKRDKAAFEFGTNLLVYAAGKRDLRNRLDSPYVPPPPVGVDASVEPAAPTATAPAKSAVAPATSPVGSPAALPATAPAGAGVYVVRLRYAGNWSPEPRAWERFANLFGWKTGMPLGVRTVAWKDLGPGAATVAHVTGTAKYAPTPAERAAAKAFVEAGGVLLVDDCGGGGAWATSADAWLTATLPTPAGPRADLTPDHPLLAGGEPGMAEGLKPRLRLWSLDRLAGKPATPVRAWRAGKGAVVACPVDLTTALLGTETWGVNGYEPASAEAFVRNVVLWAADGCW
jgi:hypothetical protein